MAIALDASASGSGLPTFNLAGVTTANSNTLVIVAVYLNGASAFTDGTVSSPNLTFHPKGAGGYGLTPLQVIEWIAVATSPLTNEIITVNSGTGAGYCEAIVGVFSGLDVTTIEHYSGLSGDSNLSLPRYRDGAVGTASAGTISQTAAILTNNANDLLVAFSRALLGPPNSADTGWTKVSSGTNLLFQYKTVSSAQIWTVTDPAGHNGILVDAYKAAGSPAFQPQMDIGINNADIRGPGPGSKEQPFLNIFKTGQIWRGTGGGTTIDDQSLFHLDADGCPTSMARPDSGNFTAIDALFMSGFGPVSDATNGLHPGSGFAAFGYYPGGNYVFKWDGTGSFQLSDDAGSGTFSGTNGRQVFNVTPSSAGFRIAITSTGTPPNHAHNFRLIYSPTSDSTTAAGNELLHEVSRQVTNPYFKDLFSFIKCLRAMPWNNTVESHITDDPALPPTATFWYSNLGPPIEVQVAVCNELNCDFWFNIPPLLKDEDIETICTKIYQGSTDTAGRVWSGLNSNLKVRTEYANEIFFVISSVQDLENRGHDAFPSLPYTTGSNRGTVNFSNRFHYGAMRQVQANRIFRTKWVALGGDPARHIRILAGGIGGNSSLMTSSAATMTGVGSTGAYTFSTTNGSISGTTFTPGAGLTGTVAKYQELTGSGIPDATYIQASNGDGTWRLNKNCGTLGARQIDGEYWTGNIIQAGANTDYDKYFDEHCTAPYYSAAIPQHATVTEFFTTNATALPYQGIGNDIAACINPDHGKGIPYVTYEGGQGYYGRQADTDDDFNPALGIQYSFSRDSMQWQAQIDSRMGTAYDTLLDAVDKSGARLFMHYTSADEDRVYAHYFGAIRSVFITPFQGDSPKYDALFNYAQLVTSIDLSPSTLSNGTVGQAYSQTITASGGTAPYTYTILSGALPTGLSIGSSTGTISGIASAPGSFSFTVQAEDANLDTGARTYSVTIAAAPAPSGDAPKGKGHKKMHFYH